MAIDSLRHGLPNELVKRHLSSIGKLKRSVKKRTNLFAHNLATYNKNGVAMPTSSDALCS